MLCCQAVVWSNNFLFYVIECQLYSSNTCFEFVLSLSIQHCFRVASMLHDCPKWCFHLCLTSINFKYVDSAHSVTMKLHAASMSTTVDFDIVFRRWRGWLHDPVSKSKLVKCNRRKNPDFFSICLLKKHFPPRCWHVGVWVCMWTCRFEFKV